MLVHAVMAIAFTPFISFDPSVTMQRQLLKSVHHTYRIIIFCYVNIYSYRRKYKEI